MAPKQKPPIAPKKEATPTGSPAPDADRMPEIRCAVTEVRPRNAVPPSASRVNHVSFMAPNGSIAFLGGYTGEPLSKHEKRSLLSCLYFNPATQEWAEFDSLGEAHPGVTQAAAAPIDGGAVLVYGGWNGVQLQPMVRVSITYISALWDSLSFPPKMYSRLFMNVALWNVSGGGAGSPTVESNSQRFPSARKRQCMATSIEGQT